MSISESIRMAAVVVASCSPALQRKITGRREERREGGTDIPFYKGKTEASVLPKITQPRMAGLDLLSLSDAKSQNSLCKIQFLDSRMLWPHTFNCCFSSHINTVLGVEEDILLNHLEKQRPNEIYFLTLTYRVKFLPNSFSHGPFQGCPHSVSLALVKTSFKHL